MDFQKTVKLALTFYNNIQIIADFKKWNEAECNECKLKKTTRKIVTAQQEEVGGLSTASLF